MQRQSWPRAWLLTDERMGDALPGAVERAAAAGAGVIVRHRSLGVKERRALAEQVLARGAMLGISRDVALSRELGAALVHNPEGDAGTLPFSLSVHNEAEALVAAARRPALVFVSPLFATRSHPGAQALGEEEALRLANLACCPAYALGGVSAARGKYLIEKSWAGWAGIDAWL